MTHIYGPVIVFGLLIFIHELGHFLLAKFNKVGVLEFAIGFGPKVWSRRYGETRYSLRLIPLGGYVKMVGDEPRDLQVEPADPAEPVNVEEVDESTKALLADRSKWFLEKNFWEKSSIVLAGPLFNILLAIVLAIASFYIYGEAVPIDKPIIGEVVPGEPAAKAGLKSKDFVKSINGKELATWKELAETIANSGGVELEFIVERNTEEEKGIYYIKLAASDRPSELAIIEGEKKPVYRIGILADFDRRPVDFSKAVSGGTMHVYHVSRMTVSMLFGLVRGLVSTKNLAGPIFIFGEAGRSAKKGLESLLGFMIFLSVGLAIFNLLPLPVLDGGHLLFFIIEAVKGGPLNLKFKEMANQVGMFLLLGLMIYVVFNDIMRTMAAG